MFTVFDLETTGFSTMKDDIIQFAYIMFDSNNMFVKSENLYFYYEGMSWSKEAENVHGISLDFLKQHKDKFEENVIKMYTVLNRANVCGHNAIQFDCPFVKNWLKRMGLVDFEFGIQQDTMVNFRPLTKRARISLQKLTMMCGIGEEEINYATKLWFNINDSTRAHDARYDVAATALLTIGGMNKNVISFENVAVPITAYLEEDVSMDNSVASESKGFDPMGYYIQCNGRPIAINHDKASYATMVAPDEVTDASMPKDLLCPGEFMQVKDNVYECQFNGFKVIVNIDEQGDIVSIVTPYGTVSDTIYSSVNAFFDNLT